MEYQKLIARTMVGLEILDLEREAPNSYICRDHGAKRVIAKDKVVAVAPAPEEIATLREMKSRHRKEQDEMAKAHYAEVQQFVARFYHPEPQ